MVDENIYNELEKIADMIRSAYSPAPEMDTVQVLTSLHIGGGVYEDEDDDENQETNYGLQFYKSRRDRVMTVQPFNFSSNFVPGFKVAQSKESEMEDENHFRVIAAIVVAVMIIAGGFLIKKEYWETTIDNSKITDEQAMLIAYLTEAILMPDFLFEKEVEKADSLEALANSFGVEEPLAAERCNNLNITKFS